MLNLAQPCHQSQPQSSSQPAQLPRDTQSHCWEQGHSTELSPVLTQRCLGARGGTQGCRDTGAAETWGRTQGQVVGHRDTNTKAWGQRVRHRYRDTGKWNTGVQGHGGGRTQEHLGTAEWTQVQGHKGAGTCAAVPPLHPCITVHQSQGNYELLPGCVPQEWHPLDENIRAVRWAHTPSEPSPGAAG